MDLRPDPGRDPSSAHGAGGGPSRAQGGTGSSLIFDAFLRLQVRLCTVDALRRRAFGREAALLDRFLAALGVIEPGAVESAHRQRALLGATHRFRGHYAMLSPSRQEAWLPVDAGVEPALRAGPVLLVATHFGGGLLTPLALSRLGIPMTAIVRMPTAGRLRASLEHPCIEICDLAREPGYVAASTAVATLRRGGVVFVAGDLPSERAADNVETAILGRMRPLPRGFAEIALTAAVRPTPVYSRVDSGGRILTWVEPPLEAEGTTRRDRAASLVHAFAGRMSDTFRKYPGNVAPPAMRRFFGES